MKIYLDSDFKCHTESDGTMREIETDCFDGKCKEYIEGFKYDDHDGLSIYPWKPYSELALIQAAVDRTQSAADAQIMDLLDTIEELIIGG